MPKYCRPSAPGLPIFFTVCLSERGSTALIDHLDILREAVCVTMRDRPFEILAWVVLPDHMHAVWRLPVDDPNYAQRWGRIKARFSRDARRKGLVAPCDTVGGDGGTSPALPRRHSSMRRAGLVPPHGPPRKGETGIWQRRFWEHHCRDAHDVAMHVNYCLMNPVKHGLVEKPTDWAASSIHRGIRLGRLPAGWSGEHLTGKFGEAA